MAIDRKHARASVQPQRASLASPLVDSGPSNAALLESLTGPAPEPSWLTPDKETEAFESFDVVGRKGGLGVGQRGGSRSPGKRGSG